MYEVCIIGLGYIGLPTAALIASHGNFVHGVDVQEAIVNAVNNCVTQLKEPGLDHIVSTAVKTGKLKAATVPVSADIFIITVPTPIRDGVMPDMSYVRQAVNDIAEHVQPGNLIILESTSVVGTTENVSKWLAAKRGKADDVFVAHSPERVIPGNMLYELVNNARVVGGLCEKSTKLAAEFYRSFVKGEVVETNARTAELAKLAENSFRDVNIAFANELSIIAEKNNVDPWELIRLTNCHPRVNVLQPGPGVGGHCIAVDPWFLVYANPEEAQLIKKAREVNLNKTEWVYAKILKAIENNPAATVACMGLTYKPDTEDIRESPALKIARRLCSLPDVKVLCSDPNCSQIPGLELVSIEKALREADVLVFLVKHKEFACLKDKISQNKLVIDTCGVLNA